MNRDFRSSWALFGPRAMSALSPLCAPRRTPRRPGDETLSPRCPIPIPTHSPIATPSSARHAKPTDTHTASVIHCIDGEIIGWLERQERRRRDTRKAAKVFLDGSCRCICVEVLCRAVLERSPCSLLFGRTRPSMRRWVRCQCIGPTIPDLYDM